MSGAGGEAEPVTEELKAVLRREFDAEEGSFLLQLRCRLNWDQEAFTRLVSATQACCEQMEGAETLERWLAEGFWYLSCFPRTWTSHENFPRPYEPSYYEKALERLDDLAYWFFMGLSPYQPGSKSPDRDDTGT